MPHVRSLVVTCGNAGKKKSSAASKLQSAASKKSLAYRVSRGGLTLEKIPQPLVERSPSVALAFTYLGDAVWELYARQHMILKRVTSSESASTSKGHQASRRRLQGLVQRQSHARAPE